MKKWEAKGVMFGENMPKGTIVRVYEGLVVSRNFALEVI